MNKKTIKIAMALVLVAIYLKTCAIVVYAPADATSKELARIAYEGVKGNRFKYVIVRKKKDSQ